MSTVPTRIPTAISSRRVSSHQGERGRSGRVTLPTLAATESSLGSGTVLNLVDPGHDSRMVMRERSRCTRSSRAEDVAFCGNTVSKAAFTAAPISTAMARM